jgi:hypothetical protein
MIAVIMDKRGLELLRLEVQSTEALLRVLEDHGIFIPHGQAVEDMEWDKVHYFTRE